MPITDSFITPEPNANPHAEGRQEMPIAPVSCWSVGAIPSVIAFPTHLDEDRLKNAFARAAAYWPVVAGRYVKASSGNTEFAISLTHSPIPFSTQTTNDEYPFPDRKVIQPSLGEYLPPLAPNYFVAGADAPLVAVRLSTLANGASVLGVNWGHVLGDAAAFSRFLEDVSLMYNMPSADLGDDMPTFEPHVAIPKATEKILKDYHVDILEPLPLEGVMKGYVDSTAQSQPFTIFLSKSDIAHIAATRTQGEKLSDGDMVIGWWISVLERSGIAVDRMVQTMNYRGFHKGHRAFPPNLGTLVANVAQQREIPLPPPKAGQKPALRARDIARTVRAEVTHLQNDPEHMLNFLSNAQHAIGNAAHDGTSFCLVPRPGGVLVNSNMRYDWAVKFGQPSACYHTDTSLCRILRVFLANPKGDEPMAASERDIELVFRVEFGAAADQVQKVIDADRERWKGEPIGEEEQTEPEVRSFAFNRTVHRPSWGGYGN